MIIRNLTLSACLLGWATAVANAQQQSMTLSLVLNKPKYLVGEPLLATFTLRSSNAPEKSDYPFSLDSGLRLEIKHKSESSYRPCAPAKGFIQDLWGEPGVTVPQNGLSETVLLAHNGCEEYYGPRELRYLFLSTPGEYDFKAVQRIGKTLFVESNIVTVDAVTPEGRNAEAWEMWKDPRISWAIQDAALPGDPDLIAGLTKLREFVERYPDTVFADYARARLAKKAKVTRTTLGDTPQRKAAKLIPDRTAPNPTGAPSSSSETSRNGEGGAASYFFYALVATLAFAVVVVWKTKKPK